MAAGKFYKASRKKRYRKKKQGPKRSLIPTKQKLKFTYATQFSANSGVGTCDEYVFSANGLYDCDVSGTGHQAMLFDQYIGVLYNHYTVIGSKITVYFANTDTGHSQICGVRLSDRATEVTNSMQLLENEGGVYKLYGPNIGSGNSSPCTMKCNPPRYLSSSKGALSNDQLRGDQTANPSEQAYWHVFCMADDGVSDAGAVNCTVVIEYIAILTEPINNITQS